MAHKLTAKRYMEQRKKMIREEMSLVYRRENLNKQLRSLRNEMQGLDLAALRLEEKK